jgi:hypothetical protein
MRARLQGKVIKIVPAAAGFAGAYSIADVIGAVNTVSEVAADSGMAVILESICVIDLTNQKSALDIYFFSEAPANTVGADNAAYVLNDADAPFLLGRINIAAANYVSSSTTNAECTVANIQLMLQPKAGSRDIYMLVVSRGTPTYGAATDLIVRMAFSQL